MMNEPTVRPVRAPDPEVPPEAGILIVDSAGRIRHSNSVASGLLSDGVRSIVGQEFGLPLGDDLRQTIEVVDSTGVVRAAEMRVAPYTQGDDFNGAWAVTIRLLAQDTDGRSLARVGPTVDPDTARLEVPGAAESSGARMDDALSLTYHELGNAVAGLSAGLTLLRDSWDTNSEEERKARLARLERSASGLAIHLKGYLDADRAHAGVFEPRPTAHELLDVVLERLPDLGAAASHVELRIPAGCPVVVDAAHCWSIVGNFINNALKHGRAPVVVSATTAQGQTFIRVADSGEGVPEERVPHLFERFTHGGEASSNGLGLWIAATMAAAYGGEVWWEAGEPNGSVFCCRLPAVAARAEADPEL